MGLIEESLMLHPKGGGGEGRGGGFDFWLFSVCLDAVSFANNIHPFDNSGLDVRRFHHHSLQSFQAICFFFFFRGFHQ